MRGLKGVLVGIVLGAGLMVTARSWSMVDQPMPRPPAPQATASPALRPSSRQAPTLKTDIIREMGQQLMECRILRTKNICAKGDDYACSVARTAITKDGIFEALGQRKKQTDWPEDWPETVAYLDDELVKCAKETGTKYQRKVCSSSDECERSADPAPLVKQ